jgi:hypothetical protein
VLLVKVGERSAGAGSILPETGAVGAAERLDHKPHLVTCRCGVATAADRSLSFRERPVIPGQPGMCARRYEGVPDLRRHEHPVAADDRG